MTAITNSKNINVDSFYCGTDATFTASTNLIREMKNMYLS